MLLRCLQIIKAAIKQVNVKRIGSAAYPKNKAPNAKATAATIEAKET
jgi:hypothetical protein